MTVARFAGEPPLLADFRATVEALAEKRLGRSLSPAERHLDLLGIDKALEQGKQELRAALEKEKRRGVREGLRGRAVILRPTDAMRAVLRRLILAGRMHAQAELESLGYPAPDEEEPPPVAFATVDPATIDELTAYLIARLNPLSTRVSVETGTVGLEVGRVAKRVLVDDLARSIPGPLDIASRIVSTAFDTGRGEVFGTSADLVTGWQYTAVMDGATCDPCAELDGSEYESWDAIQEVLPNGGPNPECDGNGRCRCMAIAAPPG